MFYDKREVLHFAAVNIPYFPQDLCHSIRCKVRCAAETCEWLEGVALIAPEQV